MPYLYKRRYNIHGFVIYFILVTLFFWCLGKILRKFILREKSFDFTYMSRYCNEQVKAGGAIRSWSHCVYSQEIEQSMFIGYDVCLSYSSETYKK